MMKKSLIYSFLLMACLFLTACGPERDAGTSQDGGSDAEATDLPEQLTIWAGNDEAEYVEEIVGGFTEETGIDVNVVPFAMDEQEEAISLDGPSGRGPDLFFQPGVGSLSLRGLVQPMDVDDEILETYSEGATDALSHDGNLYGLPAVVESLALYYNEELVPEAPETMAELEAMAEELTDHSNDQYGFLYPATDFYYSFPIMQGYDGYIFNEEDFIFDINDVGLANEGSIQGGELIQSWFESGYLMTGVTSDIASGLFTEGKVGAIINGPWALREMEEALGEHLATAPFPQLDNGEYPITFLGIKGWMLSQYSEYPEAATDLAIYLTSEESLSQYYADTGEMPANSNILASDEFQEDPLLTGFATQLERARPFIPEPALSAVWDPMADALEFITNGEDVKQSLENAVEEIEFDIEQNYTQ